MSFSASRNAEDKRRLSFIRVRDAAFDAVYDLWVRRKAEGVTQKDISETLGRDPGWVSRALAGPSNWTLKTIGELADALNGDVSIKLTPRENHICKNYDIYSDICCNDLTNLEVVPSSISNKNGSVLVNVTIQTTYETKLVTSHGG
jgi:hypothetical protein